MVSLNNNFFKFNQNKLNGNIKLGNVQQNNPTTVKNAGSGLKNINPVSISADSPTISLNDGNFNFDFNFDNLQQVNIGGSFKRNTVSGGLRFNFLKKGSTTSSTTNTPSTTNASDTKDVKNDKSDEPQTKKVWTGSTQLKDFYKTAGQTWSSFMEEFSEKVDFSSLPKELQPEGTITIKEKSAFGAGEKNYVAMYDGSTVKSAASTSDIKGAKNDLSNETVRENPWTGSTTLNKFLETTGQKWSDFMNTYADMVDFSSLPKKLQPQGTITIKENDNAGEKPYVATYEAPETYTTSDNAYEGYTDPKSPVGKKEDKLNKK